MYKLGGSIALFIKNSHTRKNRQGGVRRTAAYPSGNGLKQTGDQIFSIGLQ